MMEIWGNKIVDSPRRIAPQIMNAFMSIQPNAMPKNEKFFCGMHEASSVVSISQ